MAVMNNITAGLSSQGGPLDMTLTYVMMYSFDLFQWFLLVATVYIVTDSRKQDYMVSYEWTRWEKQEKRETWGNNMGEKILN